MRLIAISISILLGTVLFTSCNAKPEVKHKLYPLSGEVMSLNAKDQTATIKHGPVGDWMGAMTMEYPVKSKSDFDGLRIGDRIKAKVDVHGDTDYDLTDVHKQDPGK